MRSGELCGRMDGASARSGALGPASPAVPARVPAVEGEEGVRRRLCGPGAASTARGARVRLRAPSLPGPRSTCGHRLPSALSRPPFLYFLLLPRCSGDWGSRPGAEGLRAWSRGCLDFCDAPWSAGEPPPPTWGMWWPWCAPSGWEGMAGFQAYPLLPAPRHSVPCPLLLGKPAVAAGGRAGCPDHCVTPVAGGGG